MVALPNGPHPRYPLVMDRHEAFAAYAAQPRPRQLKRLAAEIDVPYETVRWWSAREGWRDKLAAHDELRDQRLLAAGPSPDVGSPDARHLAHAQEMQAVGRQMLVDGDSSGGLLIERGVKLEQQALAATPAGPTDREQVMAETLTEYGEKFRQHVTPLAERFEAFAESMGDDSTVHGLAAGAWQQAASHLRGALLDFADDLNALHAEA